MKAWMGLFLSFSCSVLGACGDVKDNKPADAPPGGDATTDSQPVTDCPVGTTALCDGANLVSCDGQGNITETTACALGCNASETRCNKVNPSNNLAGALDDAAGATDLVLAGDATIDTDSGSIMDSTGAKTPLTQTLTAGLPIGIFVIKAKTITAERISVTGTKALALVADGPITLNGRVSVDGRLDVPGPGALTNDANCRGGTGNAGTNGRPGGGGGGFGTAGGRGGSGGSPTQAGGAAGAVSGNVEMVPLRGGCSGGHPGGLGFDTDPGVGDPGGGGGAIQVVSNTSIVLGPSAFISANGAGGKSHTGMFQIACLVDTPCGDGQGGGSGGGILLEAPSITVDSTGGIVANGGAGQCNINGVAPSGGLTSTPAQGPACTGDTGVGGNGGAGAVAAGNGGNGLNDDPVGGGGGGGVGRIRINLPNGQQFQTTGVVSPAHSLGVLQTR